MANTTEWVNGGAPGISAERLNEPFHVAAATYDGVGVKIDVTFGPGRAVFLTTIVEKLNNSTYSIASPATNTTYYVYLKSDGTFTHNTTGTTPAGAVRLGRVITGATVDAITRADDRGLLPGAAARVVQDNLDAHAAAADPHSQYATDTDLSAHAANADAHHAKAHAHDGTDGSGTVAHGSLTGVTADQHHAKLHAADHVSGGADALSGTLAVSVTGDADTVDGKHAADLNGWELIAETTLGADAASVVFDLIPSWAESLLLEIEARVPSSTYALAMRFNDDAGTNYGYREYSSTSTSYGQAQLYIGTITSAATPGRITAEIANRTGHEKAGHAVSWYSYGTSSITTGYTFGWKNSAKITKVLLYPNSGNMAAGSKFRLYGRRA